MTWTPSRLEQLRELWMEQTPDGKWRYERVAIADILGVSTTSLIAKLGRMFAHSELIRRHPNSPKVIPTQGRTRSVLPERPRARQALSGPIAPPRTCQWPLWAHQQRAPKPPLYCEAEISLGSYCAVHRRLAYHA